MVDQDSVPQCSYLPTGQLVAGRYRIIRTLGVGGMASVYLAEDEVLGEAHVALKILKETGLSDTAAERFLREVRLTHKIHHENVVRTFDFGQDAGVRFYTMEYLEGKSLSTLAAHGVLPIPVILRIAIQICRGLAAIHDVGVIHRDMKPDNIMIVGDMRVKITDFGVARGDASMLTGSAEQIIGTIAYLAPETLIGEKVTNAVDYYALGAILYELLTGHLPIEDEIPARLILRKIDESPTDPRAFRPEIPGWLAEAVGGLLDPDPACRTQAMREFALRLAGEVSIEQTSDRVFATNAVSISEMPTRMIDSLSRWRVFGRVEKGVSLLKRMTLACVLSVVAVPVSVSDVGAKAEYAHLDHLFSFRGATKSSDDVVVVAMDEQSYLDLKVPMSSAWPRGLHAKLLQTLSRAGARRVVFDILFVSPSDNSKADAELSRALSEVPSILGASLGVSQQATLNGAFSLEQLIRPDAMFELKAKSIGIVGLPQQFGRIRGFYTAEGGMFADVPSLAEAGSGLGEGQSKPTKRDLINFYGASSSFRRFSYRDVISEEGRIPPEAFRDKIVLVGLILQSRNGPSQREAFLSPFDTNIYGTEIHATAISNLLQRDWISRLSPTAELVMCGSVTLVISSVLCLLVGMVGVVTVVVLGAGVLVAQYLLFTAGWFLPVLCPVISGVAIGVFIRFGVAQIPLGRFR